MIVVSTTINCPVFTDIFKKIQITISMKLVFEEFTAGNRVLIYMYEHVFIFLDYLTKITSK